VYLDAIKLNAMINNYLIFLFNDPNNNVTINCTREDLINQLISEELINSADEYNTVDFIIFENGIRIKG
jgi:hypothetical protein